MEEEPPYIEIEAVMQQAQHLGISLHAIVGSSSPKTTRLVEKIKSQPVIILIDTSSTHIFMDVNVARKTKLPVEFSQLVVQVANGKSLPFHGCCKAVHFALHPYEFSTNLYLITQGRCDIVLGVD